MRAGRARSAGPLGWRAYVPVALALGMFGAVGATVVLAARTWGFPEPPPDIVDARACPGSNVELTDVTAHFAVKLPEDATGLHFSSGLNPFFGEYNLEVSFRTTPAGLRTLVANSGFTMPKPADRSEVPSAVACPGPLNFQRGLIVDTPDRTLVIETSDPLHPLVYIRAIDL